VIFFHGEKYVYIEVTRNRPKPNSFWEKVKQKRAMRGACFKMGYGMTSYGLRRQAERDAALDPANLLGCHASAVAAALCQRSPKAITFFMRLFLFANTP
jgi:hypothetical protein